MNARGASNGHETVVSIQPFVCDGMLFYADGTQYTSLNIDAMPSSAAPRHVLVLGMGRSGTTACAQVLSALGFVCDTEDNPVLESKRLRGLRRRGRAKEFLEEVSRWDSGTDRWFWKEPKLHAGGFRNVVLAAPPSVGYLAVFRDVFNVALRNQQAMNLEFFSSLEKAARNNERVVEFVKALRHRKLAIISYEKLILRTERTVETLARFLGVQDQSVIRAAITCIAPESERYQRAAAGGVSSMDADSALIETETATARS